MITDVLQAEKEKVSELLTEISITVDGLQFLNKNLKADGNLN